MNNTLRYRNQGGADVKWVKTGTNDGPSRHAIGRWECKGCGERMRDVAASWAEDHARNCRAC
ncbi:hypothetical protein ABZW11_17295 [Nonomuraea sp. NPDC004580]|uniref:hypothetical protein n=1 Tax=Nonomuraea sp. NPDC004580 TaxID=3154552 RepID=UPI0033A176D6